MKRLLLCPLPEDEKDKVVYYLVDNYCANDIICWVSLCDGDLARVYSVHVIRRERTTGYRRDVASE